MAGDRAFEKGRMGRVKSFGKGGVVEGSGVRLIAKVSGLGN